MQQQQAIPVQQQQAIPVQQQQAIPEQQQQEIVEQQQIRPAVDSRVFSLSQANEALQLVSKGPINGKVIIQM